MSSSSSSSSSSSNKDSKIIITRLVKKFNMKAHPEGGFYAETYRSPHKVKSSYGERSASTAIYFLITPGSVSRLHRIKADEVWHFYLGGPMTVLELNESDGSMKKTVLGSNVLSSSETVQYTVKANTWFGSYPNPGTSFSFVGCTVSPGFEFEDFELASRSALVAKFPKYKDEIHKLTIGLP
eukprot:g2747.t1